MGEEALVDYSGGEWYVGSTDATTCLIVVAVCPITHKAWAAHYNGSLAARDTSIQRLLPRHMRAPEVYLVGSFREPTGESAATLAAVLRRLHAAPLPLRVRLAVVDAANTDAAGAPRALHLAVRCEPGAAGAGAGRTDVGAGGAAAGGAAWVSSAGFADRGPELPRRFAHDLLADRSHSDSATFDSGTGDDGDSDPDGSEGWGSALRSIVDTATGRLRVPGLRFRAAHPYLLAHYMRQLQLPDAQFLQGNSTSPDYEPPNFVGDIRAAYCYILDQYAVGVTRIPDAWFEWAGDVADGAARGDGGQAQAEGALLGDANRERTDSGQSGWRAGGLGTCNDPKTCGLGQRLL